MINRAKKGKQFEREVANAIGHIFPEAQRMLEYQASNNIGVDIEGTDIFRIQCKNYQNYVPISKIHEIRDPDPKTIPVLVTKGNKLKPMAVMPFDKFIVMLEQIYLKKDKEDLLLVGQSPTESITFEGPETISVSRPIDHHVQALIDTPPITGVIKNTENSEYHPTRDGVPGEKTLPVAESVRKLNNLCDFVEVEYLEDLDEDRICFTFRENGCDTEHDYYLWINWRKEGAFARLLAFIRNLEKQNKWTLFALYVSDIFIDAKDEIPQEAPQPKISYSFL